MGDFGDSSTFSPYQKSLSANLTSQPTFKSLNVDAYDFSSRISQKNRGFFVLTFYMLNTFSFVHLMYPKNLKLFKIS